MVDQAQPNYLVYVPGRVGATVNPQAELSEGWCDWLSLRCQLAWRQSIKSMFRLVIAIFWILWGAVRWVVVHWQLSMFLSTVSAVSLCILWVAFKIHSMVAMITGVGRGNVFITNTAPPPPIYEPFLTQNSLNVILCLQALLIVFLVLKPGRVSRVCEHGFKVEGVRAGSALTTTTPPDFLAELWVKHTRFSPARREGTCFRIGAYIYTARHLFDGARAVWIKYGGKYMEVALQSVQLIDVDVVRFAYEPVSALQMGSGKFSKHYCPQYVNCHNGDVGSMGKISKADVVGMLDYSGSTTPSFSGAPYFLNKVVFGLHVGAGIINVGVDSVMINCLINCYRPENDSFTTDPDELYAEMQRTGGEVKYRRTANDYYIVEVKGKYITYSEDEFEEAYEAFKANSRQTTYPKYQGEGVTAAELSALGVNPEPRSAPAPKKPVVLTAIPEEPQSAAFTYQDEEPKQTSVQGNDNRPAASVTLEAGPSKTSPVSVSPVKLSTVLPTEFHSPQVLPANTVGLKRQIAKQNVLSHITYDTLKAWLSVCEQLERDGITPNVAELKILREMWFGRSAQTSE